MFAVYDGENRLVYGPTNEADATVYVREVSICLDTSKWTILPIEEGGTDV